MSGFSRTKGTKGSMGTCPKLAAPFSKDWPLLFKSSQTTKTTIHREEAIIIRSYDSVTSPTLAASVGQTAPGNWQLRIKDLSAQDIGKLSRWKLELTR